MLLRQEILWKFNTLSCIIRAVKLSQLLLILKPNHRLEHTYEKRIVHTPSIGEHIANGEMVVEKKCKNEFKRTITSENDCYLADRLLIKIFVAYQRAGVLPEEEAFIQ